MAEQKAEGKRQKAKVTRPAFRRRAFQFCLLTCAFCFLIFSPACRPKGALLDQAQAAWDRTDFPAAAARYEDFLREEPHHEQAANAHFKVAHIYYLNLRQYDKATEHYIQLIEEFPKCPQLYEARQQLAECYAAMDKRREAISEYENLLTAFPSTPDRRRIRLNIADLYYKQDLSQALVEYQKVVKDTPYDELSERAYLRIGGIRFLRDEFEAAIPAYQLVDQNTRDAAIRRQARYGLADCYERTFDFEAAVKVLEQTERDPKAPDYIPKRIAGIRERQRQRKLLQPDADWPKRQ